MYNEKVAKFIQEKYGSDALTTYAKINVSVSKMLSEDAKSVNMGVDEYGHDYDAFWWEEEYKHLLEVQNKKH